MHFILQLCGLKLCIFDFKTPVNGVWGFVRSDRQSAMRNAPYRHRKFISGCFPHSFPFSPFPSTSPLVLSLSISIYFSIKSSYKLSNWIWGKAPAAHASLMYFEPSERVSQWLQMLFYFCWAKSENYVGLVVPKCVRLNFALYFLKFYFGLF